MNEMTSAVVWMALQVFLFTLVGGVAFLSLRRRGPSAAGACAAIVLAITLPIVLVMVSPAKVERPFAPQVCSGCEAGYANRAAC